MKIYSKMFALLIALATLCSCSNNNVSKAPVQTNQSVTETTGQIIKERTPSPSKEIATIAAHTIKDYYVYKENTKYTYEGKGNEYASYNISVEYISGSRVQIRTRNGGSETVKVLENKGNELTVVLSRGECYYREDLTRSPETKGEILLKEPLVKGTTWYLSDKRKRFISNIDVQVTTPLGSYKALEVITEGKDDKIIDYYAPAVGLIKSVFTSNGSEISSTLSKIENNVPLTQTVNFYYPNINEDKIYFVAKQLSFKTNDITKQHFEKAFKELPNVNFAKVLGPDTKINSLYMNTDNMVYLDFSKEMISQMNAGSGYEAMILQSITNTIGSYYGVDKVYITVDGKPYSSGHR